jgi:hypothetical protein
VGCRTVPGTATCWNGEPPPEEKRDVIDTIKEAVSKGLTGLSGRRLREQPQPQWQNAYAYRGAGSTRERRNSVEAIYARWVPIPTGTRDADAEEFLLDVKSKVLAAIGNVRKQVEAQRAVQAR